MANYGTSDVAVSGRYNVWVPNRTQGAFVSFDSAAEAQASVRANQMGIVLNPAGQLDPALQVWSMWSNYRPHFPPVPVVLNPSGGTPVASSPGAAGINTSPTPPAPTQQMTPGKENVWLPPQIMGLSAPSFPAGAYLAFDTAAEAQAYATARGAVMVDAQGNMSTVQPWPYAVAYKNDVRNPMLTPALTPGQFNVWFPPAYLGSLRLTDTSRFAQHGAFLSFNSAQEAQEHVASRGLGVVYDPQGNIDAVQVWSGAGAFKAVWPPPSPVNDKTPTTEGTADIIGVYGRSTSAGAQMVVRTHNKLLNETLSYQLYVLVNGTEMKVKDLGTATMTSDSYMLDATFDIDYAEVTKLVSAFSPGTTVGKGTVFGVRVQWPSGHDQGAGASGGQGAHRLAAP